MEQSVDPTDGVIRLAVVDDFEVIVGGVAQLVEPFSDRVTFVQLVANVPVDEDVDIAMYDSFAQGEAHSQDLQALLDNPHARRVVMYTWRFAPELVDRARRRGVAGYVSKQLPGDELVDVLERIHRGEDFVVAGEEPDDTTRAARQKDRGWPGKEHGLSEREAEVLALVTCGLSNAEIAELLWLSQNSIKTHLRGAYRKIGVSRRTQAVLWGVDHGMRPDDKRIEDWRSAT